MKNILISSLALAALLMAGCAKNNPVEDPSDARQVRISASAADFTSKVSSSTKGRFTWTKGDAIGVWTGSGITRFELDPAWEGFGYGEFVGEIPAGGAIDANSYAVYPYDENGTATATTFEWSEIDKFEMPVSRYMLYAKGATEKEGKYTFSFSHTTAYFRVLLQNVPAETGGLYFETADGGCFAKSAAVDFSTGEITYPSIDESTIYKVPEHKGAIESLTVIIPIKAGTYAQKWGNGGLKFRIALYTEPNWWSTLLADHAGYFGAGEGYTVNIGEYYVFEPITYPNPKAPDDSGTGINDGIEESAVNEQDPDGFWNISLN